MNRRGISVLVTAMMFAVAAVFAASSAAAIDPSVSISAPPSTAIGARAMSAWDGTTTTRPTIDGQNIKIASAAELAWLATPEAASQLRSDKQIEITADIDLGGHEWTPIAAGANITLNGGGHIIKGLTAREPRFESFGLFGTVDGGDFTASDLHLSGVDINVGAATSAVGALIAGAASTVDITGCTVLGRISSVGASSAVVGGLVGKAMGGLDIKRCVADIAIEVNGTSYDCVGGGLIGRIEIAGVSISNCAVYGSVYVKGRAAGGAAGLVVTDASLHSASSAEFSSITNAASITLVGTGSDTDNASFGAGGIVGVSNNTIITIASSANYGAIKSEGEVESQNGDIAAGAGGLVGAIFGEDISLGDYLLSVDTSANFVEVASTMTGKVDTLNDRKACLGAGGLVGSSYYSSQANSLTFEPSMTRSRNTGGVAGNYENSAGGMIGYFCTIGNQTNATIATISISYNSGSVKALNGTAGGIVGSLKGVRTTSSTQNTTMKMSQVYSSVVPTGLDAFGFLGTYNNSETVLIDTDAKHPRGNGTLAAHPLDVSRSNAANMDDRATFVHDTSPAFWNGYLDDGTLPPELQRTSPYDFSPQLTFALRSTTAARLDNGDVAISIIEFPDGEVRATDTAPLTYDVSVGGNVIASGLRLDNGTLTIPAHAALVDGARITINDYNPHDVSLSLNFAAPVGEHEVREIAVRGVPLTPEDRTTKQLYIEWTDANGEVHSADRPLDMPSIEWSVLSPADSNWQVDVAPVDGDPFRASLTIGAPKSADVAFQEYAVRVALSYSAASDDIVYVRKFYAGLFPTKVMISPENAEMIDSANSVLARTKVAILPGNFQPPIPAHIQAMIERRLDEGLVMYDTGQDISSDSSIKADTELFVLDDMDMIESMMVESPVESSLPICFTSAKKDSANITLDLANGPAAVRDKVVLLPMTFSVTFGKDEMAEFFGADAEDILAAPTSETNLAKIFDVLVLHKRIKEGAMTGWYTRLVDGVSSPTEALALGMLQAEASEDELTVRLAYNVINFAGESFVVSGPYTEGGSDTIGYMILPDGLQNDRLVDPLWSNLWMRSQNDVASGGGGGGCAVGTAAAALAALIAALRKRG